MTGMRPVGRRHVLPTIPLAGKGYFVDLEARLFRETMNPCSYVDFDSVKGQQFCREAGVVTCLGRGMSVIVPPFEDLARSRCMRCGRPVFEPTERLER